MSSDIQHIPVHYQNKMMQIQPSDNLMEPHEANASQNAHRRRCTPTDAVVNELGHRFESLVQIVMQSDTTNTEALSSAKKALADGTLDTPESHLAAAENILNFGI